MNWRVDHYGFFTWSTSILYNVLRRSNQLDPLDETIKLLGVNVGGLGLLAIEIPEAFMNCFISFFRKTEFMVFLSYLRKDSIPIEISVAQYLSESHLK